MTDSSKRGPPKRANLKLGEEMQTRANGELRSEGVAHRPPICVHLTLDLASLAVSRRVSRLCVGRALHPKEESLVRAFVMDVLPNADGHKEQEQQRERN
jgi:hypothetical protein